MNIFQNASGAFVFFYEWIRKLNKRQNQIETNISSFSTDLITEVNILSDKVDAFELSQGQDIQYHTHNIIDVSELQSALDSKADSIHYHEISDVMSLQEELDLKEEVGHHHTPEEIDGFDDLLDTKADVSHTHNISDITDLQDILDDKADINHTQTIDTIDNLQNSLNEKASLVHGHEITSIDNLQTSLDGKASITHRHAISDIDDLQTNLNSLQTAVNGKAAASHAHIIADIAGLQDSLNGKASLASNLCKYAKTNLTTNNSGVWTQNLGAGLFTNSPSLNVQSKMPSGLYTHNARVTSGNSADGFVVTVTFTQINTAVTGILGLISLILAISAPITFDIQAFEPN